MLLIDAAHLRRRNGIWLNLAAVETSFRETNMQDHRWGAGTTRRTSNAVAPLALDRGEGEQSVILSNTSMDKRRTGSHLTVPASCEIRFLAYRLDRGGATWLRDAESHLEFWRLVLGGCATRSSSLCSWPKS